MNPDQEPWRERLQQLREEPSNQGAPWMAEVEYFAAQCARLSRTQEKLIAISDSMQAQLAERSRDLTLLNEQKDLFFSIIAHDLRGPLGSFVGVAGLLETADERIGEERRQELLRSLHQAGRRLNRLLENLLSWSRIQMGQVEFVPRMHPLDELVSEAAGGFEEEVRRKGVALRCPPSGLRVVTDRDALLTVLRNLLGNAVKFTPQGGEIGLMAAQKGEEVEVRVADNGLGMDRQTREHLFDIGVKTAGFGTDRERGSGLGLILCKDLVQRLGGRMEVESELGIGSVFRFTLPGAKPSET